jgi:hypothetical protein
MKNLLIYKFILLNALALLWLVGTDIQTHWFRNMLTSDKTFVTGIILVFFVIILARSFGVARETNRASNRLLPDGTVGLTEEIDIVGDLRYARIEWLEKAAGWMLFLGLIGTLMGLQVSLSGVNAGSVGSLEGIKTMAVQMVSGLRIEISTTIIGAIFSLWTEVNYTLIKSTVAEVAAVEDEILMKAAMAQDREEFSGIETYAPEDGLYDDDFPALKGEAMNQKAA